MDTTSLESWDEIQWQPREVHELGGDRYLVLIEATPSTAVTQEE